MSMFNSVQEYVHFLETKPNCRRDIMKYMIS